MVVFATGARQAPPPITVLPNSGILTDENGSTSNVTVTINDALNAGQSITFTVTSSEATEAVIASSGQGPAGSIAFIIHGPVSAGAAFPISIIGVDDVVIDGPRNFSVSVAFTSTQTPPFGGFTIPDVQGTNLDNDVPRADLSRISGVVTSESGGSDTFSIVLASRPTSNVTLSLSTSNPSEGTVSTSALIFSPSGIDAWNVPHVVTVTGVDDPFLDQTTPYSIVTSSLSSADINYNGLAVADVDCVNLDNENPEDFKLVAGGCGLLGLEALLLSALARTRRARKRLTKGC